MASEELKQAPSSPDPPTDPPSDDPAAKPGETETQLAGSCSPLCLDPVTSMLLCTCASSDDPSAAPTDEQSSSTGSRAAAGGGATHNAVWLSMCAEGSPSGGRDAGGSVLVKHYDQWRDGEIPAHRLDVLQTMPPDAQTGLLWCARRRRSSRRPGWSSRRDTRPVPATRAVSSESAREPRACCEGVPWASTGGETTTSRAAPTISGSGGVGGDHPGLGPF